MSIEDLGSLRSNIIMKKTFKTIHQLSCFVGHPVLPSKHLHAIIPYSVIKGYMYPLMPELYRILNSIEFRICSDEQHAE